MKRVCVLMAPTLDAGVPETGRATFAGKVSMAVTPGDTAQVLTGVATENPRNLGLPTRSCGNAQVIPKKWLYRCAPLAHHMS